MTHECHLMKLIDKNCTLYISKEGMTDEYIYRKYFFEFFLYQIISQILSNFFLVTLVFGVPIRFFGRPALTTSSSNSKIGTMGTLGSATSTKHEQIRLISFQSKGSSKKRYFFNGQSTKTLSLARYFRPSPPPVLMVRPLKKTFKAIDFQIFAYRS